MMHLVRTLTTVSWYILYMMKSNEITLFAYNTQIIYHSPLKFVYRTQQRTGGFKVKFTCKKQNAVMYL